VPTLEQLVAAHAAAQGDDLAYVGGEQRMTWREYDARAEGIAAALVDAGVAPGDRVAVCLPDGPAVHACFVGIERAGAVVVGIGPRAGRREVAHLLGLTGASLLLWASDPEDPPGGVATIAVSETDLPVGRGAPAKRGEDLDALWLLNSTSGTTGLPKCVMHHQRRWFAFHDLAVDAGELSSRDVFLSALPAPFGFGLWTGHVTPTVLGVPCVVLPRFDAEACLAAIERERVTVLAAVSTQFVMVLNAPTLDRYDLTSLRVLFTGGEMVPERRAAEFEDRTGCRVLQFYGSNETGALSRTTVRDTRERRLRTAGAVIPSMHVRLLADDGTDVTATGGPGVAACRGPLCCLGGGKNISAAQVEDEVSTHPAVAVAAAVAMPDPVFGERVCAYVELRPHAAPLDLAALQDHLVSRGVGKELWPEYLVVLDVLPRASGGKVAKGALRDDVRRRVPTAER